MCVHVRAGGRGVCASADVRARGRVSENHSVDVQSAAADAAIVTGIGTETAVAIG